MNKGIAFGLSLASAVYAAIAPSDVSYAQGKVVPPVAGAPQPSPVQPQPIKFGDDSTVIYVLGKLAPAGSFRDIRQNYGNIFYKPNGGFELGGVLSRIEFDWKHEHDMQGKAHLDTLVLTKGDSKVSFYDRAPHIILPDYATINGVNVELPNSSFYESEGRTGTIPERLRQLFKEWKKQLNIGAVKSEAERLKTPERTLLESLDAFKITPSKK